MSSVQSVHDWLGNLQITHKVLTANNSTQIEALMNNSKYKLYKCTSFLHTISVDGVSTYTALMEKHTHIVETPK
jgi:hypothetical protein